MAVRFESVSGSHRSIAIVASGSSARGLFFPPGFTVIAVNGAITWVNRADYFFTLDISKVNRQRLLNQRKGTKYFAAVPVNFGGYRAKTKLMRLTPPNNVQYLKRLTGEGILGSKAGLSEDRDSIHTGNSAYGGLGLAYHFRPEKIVLFGVDADKGKRVEGGYSSNLEHLPELFNSATEQLKSSGIKIKVANLKSKVTCFERCSIDQGLKWLMA